MAKEIKSLGNTPDERAVAVKKFIASNEGKFEGIEEKVGVDGPSSASLRANIAQDLKASMQQLDSLRVGDHTNNRAPIDLDFGKYAKERWGFAGISSLYDAIGIDMSNSTVHSLMNMPDFNDEFRWLVPEVIREAVRLGLRKAPIYPQLIASEESISQPSVTMPFINMSAAIPKIINEAEVIPVGDMSFGEKTVKTFKIGKGIQVSDEVLRFVNLNIISLYLQDVGVKLGQAQDTLGINTLINGEQADGSESSPVIGTETVNVFAYKDFLRTWIRMNRIGKNPISAVAGEDAAIDALLIAEFKGFQGETRLANVDLKTPVPNKMNMFVHGSMPANKIMIIDPTMAMIKLNAMPLRVESDRIVNKQVNGTYVSLMTGYSIMFRDARVILDKAQTFASAGFPSYMDVNAAETVNFE